MVAAELPVVTAYARRRVRDPDDVVSEVFATAWRHRDRLPDPVRPWLLRVASHQILHTDRSEMRRRALIARVVGGDDPRPEADHADTTVERLDAGARVDAALARLRPLDREVLRLAAWEQLSPPEMAVVLDCTVTAAKVRLHRARRRFAAALDDARSPRPTPATQVATTREATS